MPKVLSSVNAVTDTQACEYGFVRRGPDLHPASRFSSAFKD